MLPELSENISSFNRQSRKTVSQVLSESIVEKAEIGSLVTKINSFSGAADYVPSLVVSMNTIQKEPMIDLFRDIDLRIKTAYDISRTLSILRSSISSVFFGEIEKVEKDILFLESYMANWTFLSGEEDLYNHTYVENFDNDLNSHIYADTLNLIPDRNGVPFAKTEYSSVDAFSGKLKFSNNYEQVLTEINENDIEDVRYYTNFSKEDISSDTDIRKIFNSSSNHVWNLTVKSPIVIKDNIFNQQIFSDLNSTTVPDFSAQVAIEVVFKFPKNLSRIRINPNINDSIDLLQIVVQSFTSSSAQAVSGSTTLQKIPVIPQPTRIKNSIDIEIADNSYVKSLILVLGQRNYTRTNITPIQSELNGKMVNQISAAIRSSRKKQHDKLQDLVIKYFLKDYNTDYIIRNKNLYNYDYTNYYPSNYKETNVGAIEEFRSKNFFSDIDELNKFKNTTVLSNIIFAIVSFSIGSKLRSTLSKTYIESNIKDSIKNVFNYSSGGMVPVSDSNKSELNTHFTNDSIDYINSINTSDIFQNVEDSGMYEYLFSIKNISFFSKGSSQIQSLPAPLGRSVFVSRKIPIDGLPMRTKMISEYFSEILYSENEVFKDKTSAEFSVSIKENPILEEDWQPIVPFADSYIRSEILFPNAAGQCVIRFIPNEESMKLFENSTQRSFGTYEINGKNVRILNFNPSNKYFISYTPINISDLKEIKLFSKSMANPVLINASSNGVNGERFESSNIDNSIQLAQTPYVIQEKLVNAVYSNINGTITSNKSSFGNFDYSSYSPVKIVFEDGSSAINLSNYIKSSSTVPAFYDSESVLFIHSGAGIIFNKYIDKPFRVVYQYVPRIFRYRIIMRSLNNSSENYSIDRLLFKFSLQKENTIENNFLKYDNKYKNKLA